MVLAPKREVEELGISRIVAVPSAKRIMNLIRAARATSRHIRFPSFDLTYSGKGDKRLDLRFSTDRTITGGQDFLALSVFGVDTEKKLYPKEVVLHAESDDLPLTYIHELGHCFDYYGVKPYGRFSSAEDELFSQWRSAVENTEAFKALKFILTLANSQDEYIITVKDGETGKVTGIKLDKVAAESASTFHEIWARSFSQYVASFQGNSILKALLDKRRNHSLNAIYNLFWSPTDFEPVAVEMRHIFQKLNMAP